MKHSTAASTPSWPEQIRLFAWKPHENTAETGRWSSPARFIQTQNDVSLPAVGGASRRHRLAWVSSGTSRPCARPRIYFPLPHGIRSWQSPRGVRGHGPEAVQSCASFPAHGTTSGDHQHSKFVEQGVPVGRLVTADSILTSERVNGHYRPLQEGGR